MGFFTLRINKNDFVFYYFKNKQNEYSNQTRT